MRKILVLFAHPRFEHSVVNRSLTSVARQHPAVTFHDLYEKYPDFNIDIKAEQELLLAHEVVLWHHPFYWYSCPPLLKQWIDLVLAFNWAYGPNGTNLRGKTAMNVITTGGTREAYLPDGRNRFTLRQLLTPFDQTAYLCGMQYLPPFAVQGTHRLSREDLDGKSAEFRHLLDLLSDMQTEIAAFSGSALINDHLKTFADGK